MGTGSSGNQGSGLPGRWKSNSEEIEIKEDGTILINGVAYTYKLDGPALKVEGQGTAATYPYELTGDTLTVTLNGTPVVYTRLVPTPQPTAPSGTGAPMPRISGALGEPQPMPRIGGGPPPTTTPPSTPAAAPASAPSAGLAPSSPGSVVPELVGKWCYMSNVNASDGGRQSNTCFALNGDGTYWYHSETSSSGQYGGTASQTDDQGRWVASGNTLTTTSNTGKAQSYTFQKQNHPKTRDPMLVVNGESFVTYFQKPPW
jgi:hypothetical protein